MESTPVPRARGKAARRDVEAGPQGYTPAAGRPCFLSPWQYRADLATFTLVPDGHIGAVKACDGTGTLADGLLAGMVKDRYAVAQTVPAANAMPA